MKISLSSVTAVLLLIAAPTLALTPLPQLVATGWWNNRSYDLRLRDAAHLRAGELDPAKSDLPFPARRAIQLARPALEKLAGEAAQFFHVETVRLCRDPASAGKFWFYVVEFWSEHESLIVRRTTPLGEERQLVALPFIVYFDEHVEAPRPVSVSNP
jgi:hypothetical protein